MSKLIKIATIGAAALLVAGCQSSPLAGWTFSKTKVARQAPDKIKGSVELEEGRMHLRNGNISQAVASFQLARLDPDSAAAANNGLAVSYAKIGRFDLADRYFRVAVSLAPAETKYVANLLRLQGRANYARRGQAAAELAALESAREQEALADARRKEEQVHRLSHGEFRIQTAAPEGAPTMKVEYRQAATKVEEPEAKEAAPEIAMVDAKASPKQFELIFASWANK
ncbi:hypothetical protein [Qipengyuania zhejiangensis]|uniref:hypothetical protein n=1 Tax=Qipengyuania zhejiangensis TaxID=3077782 RepID=UPI002D788E72|nr:hypothetical protein [Qipengyuania sp. Z2]